MSVLWHRRFDEFVPDLAQGCVGKTLRHGDLSEKFTCEEFFKNGVYIGAVVLEVGGIFLGVGVGYSPLSLKFSVKWIIANLFSGFDVIRL